MKKVKITNKVSKKTFECMAGNIGEHVFSICKNVDETNRAIRWCNSHVVGDSLDTPMYRIEIFGVKK